MSNPHEEYPGRPESDDTASYGSPTDDTTAYGWRDEPAATTPVVHQPEQRWARGTSWATVAFGLVCMAVAGLALTFQLADVRVDWEIAGPATVIGLGALLVVVGVIGLFARRQEE